MEIKYSNLNNNTVEQKFYVIIKGSDRLKNLIDSENEKIIKSKSENDFQNEASKKRFLISGRDNSKQSPNYSNISDSPVILNNIKKSSSQTYQMYDDMDITILTCSHKYILSASQSMPCIDFINQLVDLIYDFNYDRFIDMKNYKSNRFGIWMEIQRKWIAKEEKIEN